MRKVCGKNGFSCGVILSEDDRLDEDEDDDFAVAIELCQSPQLKRRQELKEIIRIDSIGGMDEMSNDPAQRYRDRQAEKLRQHVEKCDSARYFADRIGTEDIRLDSKEIAKLSDAELSRIPLKTLKQWGVIS